MRRSNSHGERRPMFFPEPGVSTRGCGSVKVPQHHGAIPGSIRPIASASLLDRRRKSPSNFDRNALHTERFRLRSACFHGRYRRTGDFTVQRFPLFCGPRPKRTSVQIRSRKAIPRQDSAAFSGSGLVDTQRPAVKVFTVEVHDCRVSLSLIRHLDKTKPSTSSRFAVSEDVDRGHVTERCEGNPQFGLRQGIRQISNVDIHQYKLSRRSILKTTRSTAQDRALNELASVDSSKVRAGSRCQFFFRLRVCLCASSSGPGNRGPR